MKPRPSGYAAAFTLAGMGALHGAWARGSSVPFATRGELADAVVGMHEMPKPLPCNAVAGLLVIASGLTVDVPVGPPQLRHLGRMTVATVLASRGLFGLAGLTEILSPGSSSPRFQELDRRIYSPLCLALSLATATAVVRPEDSKAKR